MHMYEFVGQVQDGARLASKEQALNATRATLETLAERLGAEDSRHLAAQLPDGIGQYLDGRDAVAEEFPPEEFLKRISAREGVETPAADYHARAVLGTLRQAVSSGEIRNVLGHLPAGYARLFAGTAKPGPNYGSGY